MIFMKKIGLPVIMLFLIVSINSCKKIKELLTFNISNTSEFTVPSSSVINLPLVFNSPEVKSSASETFSSNGTSADKVKDVKLESVKLSVLSPSGKTFSFLKSIKIYISGGSLPEKLLASKENITDDVGSELNLDVTSDKLDDYAKLSTYSLRYEIITDQTITEDVKISALVNFKVTADPL
jgi:hypothetical protein